MHLSVIEPLDITIEQFLSMVRFESKGKLDNLGLRIDINPKNMLITGTNPRFSGGLTKVEF